MATIEASLYLSAIEWGDEGYYLKEFTRKFQLPRVAKIIKGQYRSIGVPTLPSPTLNQIVLIASAGTKLKVIAQCVKFKDTGRRAVPIGSKLALPENYDGWFEILSEDGYSCRCIESVAELAKSTRPCLVRDPIKVYVSKTDDVDAISDKTRTLCSGEILNVEQLVSVCKGRSRKFLKCVSSHGDTVYLPFELRGKFSNIAGEQNISGVHSVKNLMNKRFPFMVRLVHGKPPAGVKFVPEMRLLSFIEEESLMAMPLSKENTVVPLPQNTPLKVLAPRNYDCLLNLHEHEILVNRCLKLSELVSDCIQVCTVNSVNDKKESTPQLLQYIHENKKTPSLYGSVLLIDNNSGNSPKINSARIPLQRELSVPANLPSHLSDDIRYDEIDKIYDYVRGFAPLPLNIKNDCSLESSCDDDLKHVSLPQIGQTQHGSNNLNYTKSCDLPPEILPTRRPFKSSTRVFQPSRNGVANLVNRNQYVKTKGLSAPVNKLKESVNEPIYEKIDHRRNSTSKLSKTNETTKVLLRSQSTSKVPHQDNININNLNEKILHQKKHSQILHQRSTSNLKQQRLCSSFNSQKDSVVSRVKHPGERRRIKTRKRINGDDIQNVATSPLFHIRYKSLTDLLLDDEKTFFPPPNDSSGNSYDSNSPSTDETKNNDEYNSRWLSRPKSLSNLINNDSNNRKKLDNYNCYALIKNDITGITNYNNPKFYTMPDAMRLSKKRYGSAVRKKKFETMYL